MNSLHLYTHAVFRTILLFVFVAGLISFTQSASAQNQGRWYKVEVLIFKRQGNAASNSEYWPQDVSLEYPEKYRYLTKTLSKSSHKLGGHSYTLNKSEDYQVLFHKAWTQQMWGPKRSPALIIRGGQHYGSHRELEGSIKIHIGRYLHVATDLWLSDYSRGTAEEIINTTDTTDLTTTNASNSRSNTWLRLPKLPSNDTQTDASVFGASSTPSRITVLRERRRMRSKEIHYIDHPMMGMLVLMTPAG